MKYRLTTNEYIQLLTVIQETTPNAIIEGMTSEDDIGLIVWVTDPVTSTTAALILNSDRRVTYRDKAGELVVLAHPNFYDVPKVEDL